MRRHRAIEVSLLLIALLPIIVLAVMAVRIWAFGAPIDLWHAPAWGLYLSQAFALFGFALHVLDNKQLAEGESSHWLWEILLYQQVAMISYWVKHVRGQPSRLRP